MNNCSGRNEIFPWQLSLWQSFCDAKQKQRLPHAILIQGASGVGKTCFATALAHTMLCQQANTEGDTCGQCHACHLMQAGSHPDLVNVAAEQPGQIIKVDQIREIVQFVNETSMQGGYRVIIIHHAHNMNHNAANSLLKTLEEPASNTLFILLSAKASRIQATIASRCQKWMLHKPEREAALIWLRSQHSTSDHLDIALNIAEGAPLKALSLLADDSMTFRHDLYQALTALSQGKANPLSYAAEWHERDLPTLFQWLLYWLQDLLKLKAVGESVSLINLDYADSLSRLSLGMPRENMLAYLTHVQGFYAKITGSLNLNRQLLLEELFIRWTLLNR